MTDTKENSYPGWVQLLAKLGYSIKVKRSETDWKTIHPADFSEVDIKEGEVIVSSFQISHLHWQESQLQVVLHGLHEGSKQILLPGRGPPVPHMEAAYQC